MAPTEQKALVLLTTGGEFAVQSKSVTTSGAGEVLARIESTALNPMDCKVKAFALPFVSYPGALGTHGAGVVEEVGEGVANLKKGDQILWQGSFTDERATFQQYALVKADLAAKIPDNASRDGQGPQGGGAGLTPFYAAPNTYTGQPLVVLGGPTSAGQYVIQLARLSGFSPIIATASVKHSDYLKSLGATHVLSRDLATEALSAEIDEVTSQPIKYVFDTVGGAQKVGWALLASGGTLVLTLPAVEGIVRGQDGKTFVNVGGNVNYPAQNELGRELDARLIQLLESGLIKVGRHFQ
ncbi:GroES-like protein [Punctularia strigosozonata HHB-11173 SS5]|uniref:GroES-like protein n=1 Tax=Punctularia strigosozonata (strain HHB-11173) TaxID=741275 RepID=R7S528_PUNST|nr:GroES-like protein [Punctularia strigosozonata HHB-11173 SS5]EIN05014.1 GroES-like protein [Punctularia strigosozonata HHB-11173 SS5]